MTNLYIDFDGVIMDTNKAITSLLEEYNISSENNEEKLEFLSKVNWHQLLNQSNEISNAFKNIQTLAQSGTYNVSILTHVCSEHESIEKTKLINEKIGNVSVIPVPRHQEKCNYVDPKNAILVDDYTKNLELWEQNGGIGIKFTNKEYNKFKSIYDLSDILNIF